MTTNELLLAALIIFGVCGGVFLQTLIERVIPAFLRAGRERHGAGVGPAELLEQIEDLRRRLARLEAQR